MMPISVANSSSLSRFFAGGATNNSLEAAVKQSCSLNILLTTSFKIKDLKELLTVFDDCCLPNGIS